MNSGDYVKFFFTIFVFEKLLLKSYYYFRFFNNRGVLLINIFVSNWQEQMIKYIL